MKRFSSVLFLGRRGEQGYVNTAAAAAATESKERSAPFDDSLRPSEKYTLSGLDVFSEALSKQQDSILGGNKGGRWAALGQKRRTRSS